MCVPHARWLYTTVADAMRPLDAVRTIALESPVDKALEIMAGNDLNQLQLMSNGKLTGMISRAHVLQLLQTRAELHV
jgi:predicted transcriptional regulator